jgi:hypothetical protein
MCINHAIKSQGSLEYLLPKNLAPTPFAIPATNLPLLTSQFPTNLFNLTNHADSIFLDSSIIRYPSETQSSIRSKTTIPFPPKAPGSIPKPEPARPHPPLASVVPSRTSPRSHPLSRSIDEPGPTSPSYSSIPSGTQLAPQRSRQLPTHPVGPSFKPLSRAPPATPRPTPSPTPPTRDCSQRHRHRHLSTFSLPPSLPLSPTSISISSRPPSQPLLHLTPFRNTPLLAPRACRLRVLNYPLQANFLSTHPILLPEAHITSIGSFLTVEDVAL